MLFDPQFLALGISAAETYELSALQPNAEDVTEQIDANEFNEDSFWETIYLLEEKGCGDVANTIIIFLDEDWRDEQDDNNAFTEHIAQCV